MSEYTEVERPFLQQLAELGWTIIHQGEGVPHDATPSLRGNFRQWLLPEVFDRAVRAINRTDDGRGNPPGTRGASTASASPRK